MKFNEIKNKITELHLMILHKGEGNLFDKIKTNIRINSGKAEIRRLISEYEFWDIEEVEEILNQCLTTYPPNGEYKDIKQIYRSFKRYGKSEKPVCITSIVNHRDESDSHKLDIYTLSILTDRISVSAITRSMNVQGSIKDISYDFDIESFIIPEDRLHNPEFNNDIIIIKEIHKILTNTAKDLLTEWIDRLERCE